MEHQILLGRGNQMVAVPRQMIDAHLDQVPEHSRNRLAFMTKKHHAVRNYVVREMPQIGEPISPERIGRDLGYSQKAIAKILDELEQNLFFLVRNDAGAVSWAFPVTTEQTAHRLVFNSGEQLYAA